MGLTDTRLWARLRRRLRGRAPHLLALALLAAPAVAGERVSTELVLAYADAIAGMERMQFGNLTGLGNAIAFASELLGSSGFDGDERKIDVSGDGRNNTGPEPEAARAAAMAGGITINGLAIAADDPALPSYYVESVIGGPGAFVVVAKNFEAFGEAFRRKLKRELSPRLALK